MFIKFYRLSKEKQKGNIIKHTDIFLKSSEIFKKGECERKS